ncbi:hypothetical protein EG19_10355 [Thermoanaerobaculum aquaticum]|uniref:FecR protein domain-containing protein n=1 Tax=Thermoanaerobaculum aquaticum TaxID=1312852 RepID=A0A062XYP7_9BACT|nr:FecR domain-containing protein [Thermoanaerobaculum aquaticum]KDA54559.1 hypothetical protein EG19_10355 [Thermoanaerobaculum aquaticum]
MKYAGVLCLLLLAEPSAGPLEYRFAEVKSKVIITHGQTERRAQVGTVALAGDRVRTGWFGRAVIEVPTRGSRFELFPLTQAVLAGEQPGVLIELKRGRLWAVFEAITGQEERLVATPGAILAVRGTAYGLEVDRSANVELAVFEGTVEVRSSLPEVPPLLVPAGHFCTFSPARQPFSRPMPQGMSPEMWRHGGGMGGMRPGDMGGRGAGGMGDSTRRPPSGMGPHRH